MNKATKKKKRKQATGYKRVCRKRIWGEKLRAQTILVRRGLSGIIQKIRFFLHNFQKKNGYIVTFFLFFTEYHVSAIGILILKMIFQKSQFQNFISSAPYFFLFHFFRIFFFFFEVTYKNTDITILKMYSL